MSAVTENDKLISPGGTTKGLLSIVLVLQVAKKNIEKKNNKTVIFFWNIYFIRLFIIYLNLILCFLMVFFY